MLKPDDVKQFRAILRMLRVRLRGDVEQLEEEAFSGSKGGNHGSSNHMAEMGTDAWELDFSLRIVENDQEVLSEIAAALARIDEGTFGLCEMCREAGVANSRAAIPKSRLRTLPYARNCVDCERKREQRTAR